MSRLHLALNTHYFDDSVHFYQTLFGREPAKLKPGYAKFDVSDPALNLTLTASPETINREAINHLGVEVINSEAVHAADERLRAEGLPTFFQDTVDCCYSVQDKTWVTDPNGHNWEFFVVKD
ncbi:MAG: catechol 2,3-dioxygenase-like lactoylglutathione lyase family enzyme [Halieaceae bacterium]|jgi:catechol 2,3-dioxygenase-like lactoylglutathione lyase family enzyme